MDIIIILSRIGSELQPVTQVVVADAIASPDLRLILIILLRIVI